jgi:hypothetical protein
MGHSVTAERKLFLSENKNVLRYDKIDDAAISNTDRTLLVFSMNREEFSRARPEMRDFFLNCRMKHFSEDNLASFTR